MVGNMPKPPQQQEGIPTFNSPSFASTQAKPLSTFLYHFIRGDIIDKEGHRILVPFLRTNDLLRLSECSKSLVKYRYYMSRIKLVPHPSMAKPAMKRALFDLLLQQELDINHLQIKDPSLMIVLDQGGWLCCRRVKDLNLSSLKLTKHHAARLGRGLRGGTFLGLEKLDLSWGSTTLDGIRKLTSALAQGACPKLSDLDLSFSDSEPGTGEAIALALKSGHFRALQYLSLPNWRCDGGELVAIARAVEAGCCPRILQLNLPSRVRPWLRLNTLSTQDINALASTIRSNAIPRLEGLNLHWHYRGDVDTVDVRILPVMEALEMGGCKKLEWLWIHSQMGAIATYALARALSSCNFQRLQELGLHASIQDRLACLELVRAIKDGGCPALRYLDMSSCSIGEEHCQVLGEAFRSRSCVKLEVLAISNCTITDQGLISILGGLQSGGCFRLESLVLSSTGLGSVGASALASSLASASFGRFKRLDVHDLASAGDRAMAEIIRGLALGCPALEALFADEAGLGKISGEALVQGLRENAWPSLNDLLLSENPLLGPTFGLSLADVLVQGAGSKLTGLHIDGCEVGEMAVQRLKDAFKAGACPRLDQFSC